MAGRVDEAAFLYPDGMVMNDHRPLIGGIVFEGKGEAMGTMTAMWDWGYDRLRRDVVDQRGDHLALVNAVMGNATAELEVVVLLALDDDGLCRRIDLFDADQLDEARAKLDELAR